MNPKLPLGLALVLSGNCFAAIISPKSAEEFRPIAREEMFAFYHMVRPSLPKNVQTNNLQITMGHEWYLFNYQAVLSGKILFAASGASARATGWNYLMLSGTNMVGVIQLGLDDKNHWKFGGFICRGPNGQPDPIWVALQKAEKLPQVQTEDYEFRFLSQGLDFQAVWLHGKADDIIIPFKGFGPWTAYQPYSESELTKLLRPEAEKQWNIALNGGLSAHTRLMRSWSEAELMQAADLVVVATPLATKYLDETNSLGLTVGEFRGVETTFKVFNTVKGMPANDRIILHHYHDLFALGGPPAGADLVSLTPASPNRFTLYLLQDGTNRYAPVTGQVDAAFSVRPLPTNRPVPMHMPPAPLIADANPAIRHAVQVQVPVRLHASYYSGQYIEIETDELGLTNLTVGTNMATGTEYRTEVFQGGRLLNLGGCLLQNGFANGGYHEYWSLNSANSLKPDENVAVEIKMTMFETDEPAQHMWSPPSGKKYQVLYEQTFKLAVKK